MTTATSKAQKISQDPEIDHEFRENYLEEQIRQRAHGIWLERGNHPGSDVEDWLLAEEEILRKEK